MLVLQAESLKDDIQQEEITKEDADKLRDIEPKRKSVQNMLETEVAQAVCYDSQISESKKKSPNSLFMHRMYAVFRYDNEYFLANLAIDDSYATDKNGHMIGTSQRLYNLKSIKITPISDKGFQSLGTSLISDGELTGVTYELTIPQLYEIVKEYDKNFRVFE